MWVIEQLDAKGYSYNPKRFTYDTSEYPVRAREVMIRLYTDKSWARNHADLLERMAKEKYKYAIREVELKLVKSEIKEGD